MIKVFAILVILSLTNDTLGQDFDIGGRIVGGYQMSISNRKFQVAVFPGIYLCGGSLIQLDWVVTAAHCTHGFTSMEIKVRAGSDYSLIGGVVRGVVDLHQHPLYDSNTQQNDISLLRLSTPFFAGTKIGTISLATEMPLDGATVTVSGYGVISQLGIPALYLLGVDVEMISTDTCNNVNHYNGQLLPGMFCAASTGKDSCSGDSGGPLTYNGALVGVVSLGNGCANSNYPGIYTSIPYFYTWIVDTMNLY